MKNSATEKLKAVTVYLEFDHQLQHLTGIQRTSIEVTEGTPFVMFLQAVLDSYPDIAHQFDYRILGFEVNGQTPHAHFLLSAYDVVKFGIHGNRDETDEADGGYYH